MDMGTPTVASPRARGTLSAKATLVDVTQKGEPKMKTLANPGDLGEPWPTLANLGEPLRS